jgi:HAD superfamily hydrolase (TIGR01509 family)
MTSPSIPGRITTVLFDIDGTLVDSNYAHVAAWMYAFHSAGCGVEAWRIHECIGMDSAKLLDRLVGDQSDAVRDQAKDQHSKRYAEMSDLLRAFDGARELLRAISARDVKVVLATSAPQDELERLRDLLDVEDAIETVTNAEDVETAKPAPDIVQVALEKSGSAASETIFVGDTVWDVRAAADAGVACVAVQSGGIHEQALRDAGAVAVFETIRELRADLEARGLA